MFGHGHTLLFLKRHLFNVPYISGHVPSRVFLLSVNVRTPKTCPLFLIKLLFFTTGIFVHLLYLPVFPVSVIDKPLCLICVHQNLLLGSIINTTAINRSSVNSNCACPDRCRMYIACLDLRLVTAHMRRLVRTYLVRIFPRNGLATWCKTNHFFKIFPTKEMHSIALIILHVKNGHKDQSVSISF